MSRSWNEQELQAASAAMKAAGHMSYEEFCEELERQNSFEKDYQEELENLKAYQAAKEAGNEVGIETARAAHIVHMAELEAKGEAYCRIYREYELSRDCGNTYLDLNDVIWDKDVESLISCIRASGIRHFTFSSTWSSAVETAWLFQQNGCMLEGLIEINGRVKKFMSDEYEKAHGYLFSIG